MDTKFLLLWLEAPLQSWGFDSKFGRRDSLDFPTKSGVLGLILCALGKSGEQRELLSRFADLKQTVISFSDTEKNKKKPILLHDFQMIGAGYDDKDSEKNKKKKTTLLHDFQMIGAGYDDDKDSWKKNHIPKKSDGSSAVGGGTKMTHRYYLQDAVFAVLLEVPSDLAQECADALKNPVWPIYLGRRCCVPSDFIFQGIFDDESSAESAAKEKADSHQNRKLSVSFKVVDGEIDGEDSFTLNDVPVQFGTVKKYRDRRVTKMFVHENEEE